jgi:hypothetical protein
MHTVDVFFEDGRGRSFALLTRAPTNEFETLSPTFDEVRASFAIL